MANLSLSEQRVLNKLLKKLAANHGFLPEALASDVGSLIANPGGAPQSVTAGNADPEPIVSGVMLVTGDASGDYAELKIGDGQQHGQRLVVSFRATGATGDKVWFDVVDGSVDLNAVQDSVDLVWEQGNGWLVVAFTGTAGWD